MNAFLILYPSWWKNLKYLIGENSEVRQPNLSEYTAFEVQGTWDEGGIGQVSLNAISESNQFLTLEGNQTIYKVGKKVSPILYSQTSSIGLTGSISLNNVSAPDSNFTNYGLSARGTTLSPVSTNNVDSISGIVGTTQDINLFDSNVASSIVTTSPNEGSIAFAFDDLTSNRTLSDNFKLQLTYAMQDYFDCSEAPFDNYSFPFNPNEGLNEQMERSLPGNLKSIIDRIVQKVDQRLRSMIQKPAEPTKPAEPIKPATFEPKKDETDRLKKLANIPIDKPMGMPEKM